MPQIKKEVILFGIPGSPGIAHGTVFRFLHQDVEVPSYQINESERESELDRFKTAVDITRDQITEIRKAVSSNLGEKEAGIFDAHLLVLEDQALFDDINKGVLQYMKKKNYSTIEEMVGLAKKF